MTDTNGSNRRRAGRVRCEDATCQFGTIQEMSRTGLRCLTKKPVKIPEGRFTHLKISCAGRRAVVAAKPMHFKKRDDGLYEQGFLFVGLSEQETDALLDLARTAACTDGCVHRPRMDKY